MLYLPHLQHKEPDSACLRRQHLHFLEQCPQTQFESAEAKTNVFPGTSVIKRPGAQWRHFAYPRGKKIYKCEGGKPRGRKWFSRSSSIQFPLFPARSEGERKARRHRFRTSKYTETSAYTIHILLGRLFSFLYPRRMGSSYFQYPLLGIPTVASFLFLSF